MTAAKSTIKTVSIRQLQHDLKTVLEWVAEGANVVITKRNKVVAEMSAPKKAPKQIVRPDFGKHLQETFSGRILEPSNVELLSMLREDRF
ncbi:MAG: type II toxin-antitoxin system Phd/YefM family antitoxin [Chthoniobacterales bacterium]